MFFVLATGYYFVSERSFNARMNEDIESFLSGLENARSEADRAEALRRVLLQTKQNTTSFVGSAFHANLFALLFLSSLLWRGRETAEEGTVSALRG